MWPLLIVSAVLAAPASPMTTRLVAEFPRSGGTARQVPRPPVTDREIAEAVTALETVDAYPAIIAAVRQHEHVLASDRMAALVAARLGEASLDTTTRGLLLLVRQLSQDTRSRGPEMAARLLAIRLVAGYALAAETPQQFAAVLEQFSPLDAEITPALVQDAMRVQGDTWPQGLAPLMEQLATDWPRKGAAAAATAMASAARGGVGAGGGAQPAERVTDQRTTDQRPASQPRADQPLAGHWRSTRVVFERSEDEHLVLHGDGRAETWTVTAQDRSAATGGRWTVEGSSLRVTWTDGREWAQPYTLFQGQLVFPNIPNQRQFWERIE